MENLSRNLAKHSGVRNTDLTRKASKCWTLLLIGERGNMVSFRVTKSLLVALITGVAAILVFVVFAGVSYNAFRVENAGLKKTLEAARAELEADNSSKQAEKKTEPASGEEAIAEKSESAKPIAAASSAPPLRPKKTTQLISQGRMSVEQFKMKRDDDSNTLEFQFYLKNVDPEGRRLSGYTFAVLEPVKDLWEHFRACPQVALADGRPSLFRKGEHFFVARFKVVRGTFSDVGAMDRYGTVTVYVYSMTGDLFVEDVFEVSKVLQL